MCCTPPGSPPPTIKDICLNIESTKLKGASEGIVRKNEGTAGLSQTSQTALDGILHC